MIKRTPTSLLRSLAITVAMLGVGAAPLALRAKDPARSDAENDARLAWWRDARFGVFVHWGPYSALGNEFHGQHGGTYGEHIMRILKIPVPVYMSEVAGSFNPVRFDAEAWVKAARDAGMKYFVITAKHHDGFAMWPTRVNRFNIVDATPWKRDPMKELRAACDKYGLKFGFYYSHAMDWSDKDAPGNDWDFPNNPGGDKNLGGSEWWEKRPDFLPNARRYVDEKVIPQLKELTAAYHPDIFWFDTPKLPPDENARILKAVREMAPDALVNGRILWGRGDYENTCDCPIEFPPHKPDWEAIPTTNDSYGWNPFNNTHKPASHFIRLLAKAAARGGNLLMNIGPMGDGAIDPKDTAILDGIGAWWKRNGDSVRGTSDTPLPVQTWGESTRKGDLLYLHVFEWPANGKLVVGGLKSPVESARLLSGGSGGALTVSRLNPTDVVIAGLPWKAPDTSDTVIVVKCAGRPVTDTRRLLQPEFPAETLHVFDATLRDDAPPAVAKGRTAIDDLGRVTSEPKGRLIFCSGSTLDDFVRGWVNRRQEIIWHVRLNRPATYAVSLDYVAEKKAGGEYLVRIGDHALKGVVTVTPGSIWQPRSQVDALGKIALPAGDFDIRIEAVKITGDELFNPRKIILKPSTN